MIRGLNIKSFLTDVVLGVIAVSCCLNYFLCCLGRERLPARLTICLFGCLLLVLRRWFSLHSFLRRAIFQMKKWNFFFHFKTFGLEKFVSAKFSQTFIIICNFFLH